MKNFKRNIYRLSGSECDFSGIVEQIPDRSVLKSKNVLILSDPNSTHPDQYVGDVHLDTIALSIQNQEMSLGMIPTVMTSYADFELLTDAQISQYAHIWDIGYDTLITGSAGNKYLTYLSSGGAIFFLGENSAFIDRDNTIVNIITLAGGGTVTMSTPNLVQVTADIAPEFLIQNQTPTVVFNAPGVFQNIGSGTMLAQSYIGVNAAVWKTGSLSSNPTAAIISVLDINFLVGTSVQQDFIDNLSTILNVA